MAEIKRLYIGFKGKHNTSNLLVNRFSGDKCLLTNSFDGAKRDIDQVQGKYDCVLMFGIDKNLEQNTVRIERFAEKQGEISCSLLDLEAMLRKISSGGITSHISDTVTHYLCNEAYYFALHKFDGKAVFFHIPSIRNVDERFYEKLKQILERDIY